LCAEKVHKLKEFYNSTKKNSVYVINPDEKKATQKFFPTENCTQKRCY